MSTTLGNTVERGPAAQAELDSLLAGIEFSHRQAALRTGRFWVVYIHPWLREEPDYFDALISISPQCPEAGAPQGLFLILHRENVIWLTDGAVDRRGQIWFRNLPHGDFRVGAASEPASADHAAGGFALANDKLAARDAFAAKSAAPDAPRGTVRPWLLFRLPDRRVTALLEEERDSLRTSLLIRTSDTALADSLVRFTIGDQTGALLLGRDEAASQWDARVSLPGSLAVLARTPPRFVITPASDKCAPPADVHV